MRLGDLGFFNATLYLCNRALKRLTGSRAFLQRYYLVAQPVDAALPMPRRLGKDLEVRRVSRGDPALLEFPRPAEILESRYEQGSACFAAYRAADFAGFIWLAPGAYLEDEVRCTFVPGPAGSACWDYDVYVTPGERTGVAFMKLWSAALEHLRQRGVEWSASRISAFAPASLAAHKRMGAVCVGQAFFLVVFGLQAMVASVPPYLHLSASRRSHPTLRVEAPRRK